MGNQQVSPESGANDPSPSWRSPLHKGTASEVGGAPATGGGGEDGRVDAETQTRTRTNSETRLTADPESPESPDPFDLTEAILGPGKGGGGSRHDGKKGAVDDIPAQITKWVLSWQNKGDLSNLATLAVLVLGLLVRAGAVQDGVGGRGEGPTAVLATYLVSFGLFGFSGGITNWLAVKMLFEKVGLEPYYLWGSGVIPRQFVAIREAVKNMILKMFFDRKFLQRYLNDRAKGVLEGVDLGAKLKGAMEDPKFDSLLEEKLTELSTKPEGMLVATMAPMFGGVPAMVPVLKPFLAAFGEELLKAMVERFDINELMPIDSVLREIELLLNEKLKLITPEMVTELLKEVIHEHLGWLVVWGNVFGGAIGLVSALAGLGM